MAYDVPGMRISLVAQEAMPKRWIAVRYVEGVDNAITIATAATDPVAGILQADARQGQISPVMINGVSMWEAGVPIQAGQMVAVGAGGRAVVGTSANRVGFALTGAAAAGDILTVALRLS